MDVIKLRGPQVCSACLESINEGEECIKFFNHIHRIPDDIKQGYLVGRGFMLHFRHLGCQYKKDKRHGSLEEFIALLKAETEQRRRKKNQGD